MMLQFESRPAADDVTVFELKGRMHLGNRLSDAEYEVRRIIEGGCRKLVVDLSGVEYIDSAALGMLLFTTGKMNKDGGKVVVAGANPRVMDVIEIAHANLILKLAPGIDDAIAALGA